MNKIIIVGGGLMGCAAAWQLARAGKKVMLIEKQDVIYTQGSSFGEARVTRSLGVENDIFTYLKETSVYETYSLIELLNDWDANQHKISDIHTDSPVTYLYNQSLLSEVEALERDESYRTAYNIDEQKKLFEINFPDKIIIREFKSNSGIINPRELIRKLKLGIELCGGEIRHNTEVDNIEIINNKISLELRNNKTAEKETLLCYQAVISAGPYTTPLLQHIAPQFENLLMLKRLYLAFFQLDKNYWDELSNEDQERFKSFFPIAHFDSEVYYSMIENMENGSPTIKVGGHMRRFEIKDQQDIWRDEVPKSEINWAKEQTLSYLSVIGFPIDADQLQHKNGYSCVYSLTPSEVPIVSPLVDKDGNVHDNLIIIAGLSGVGAKGTLAYGRHAADYILGNNIQDEMYQLAKKAMGIDRLKGN